MKFMKCKKLIIPAVLVSMLASIPVYSNAYTTYRNSYTLGAYNFTENLVGSSNNYTYSPNVSDFETRNSQYKNTYVISRGNYRRPQVNTDISIDIAPRPVEVPDYIQPEPWPEQQRPVPQPQPEPWPEQQRPVPQPQPEPWPEQQEPLPQPQPESWPENEQAVTKPNENINTGSTSNANHSLSSPEIELAQYVNSARQQAGLEALQIDVDLSYVARLKSQDMDNNKYFSHDSPTYGSPFEMMTKFGINYRGAAENIAKTNGVFAAHNGFMRSQGHKENILNPIYTHLGIGISNGYYTEMFIRK